MSRILRNSILGISVLALGAVSIQLPHLTSTHAILAQAANGPGGGGDGGDPPPCDDCAVHAL